MSDTMCSVSDITSKMSDTICKISDVHYVLLVCRLHCMHIMYCGPVILSAALPRAIPLVFLPLLNDDC